MSEEKKPSFTFSRTISLDGVSIIVACVLSSLWFGSVKEQLREHSEHIARQDQTLLTMSQTVQLLSENVKVLTTLVNERTLHKP